MAKKDKAGTDSTEAISFFVGDLNFVRYEKLVKVKLHKKVGPRIAELIHQDMAFLEETARIR